jgi:hypothetical protein
MNMRLRHGACFPQGSWRLRAGCGFSADCAIVHWQHWGLLHMLMLQGRCHWGVTWTILSSTGVQDSVLALAAHAQGVAITCEGAQAASDTGALHSPKTTVWALGTAINGMFPLDANPADAPKCVYAVLHCSHRHATASAAAAGKGTA